MPSGLIISTQSPADVGTSSCPGGAAEALSRATKHPVIEIHPDGRVRSDACGFIAPIADGDIVYITGHGRERSDTFSGVYSPADNIKSVMTKWDLHTYVDLITSNSNLQEGDSLTLVLWACNSGAGGINSTAAKLGNLFRYRGINTRIIASVAPLQRFDGRFLTLEDPDGRLRYRVERAEHIRVFDCLRSGITEWHNRGHLCFTPEGICGLNLIQGSAIEPPLLTEMRTSSYYLDCAEVTATISFLENNPQQVFILQESAVFIPNTTVFTAFFSKISAGIGHLRFAITADNKLFYCSKSILSENEIIVQGGIVATILRDISKRKEFEINMDEVAMILDEETRNAMELSTSETVVDPKLPRIPQLATANGADHIRYYFLCSCIQNTGRGPLIPDTNFRPRQSGFFAQFSRTFADILGFDGALERSLYCVIDASAIYTGLNNSMHFLDEYISEDHRIFFKNILLNSDLAIERRISLSIGWLEQLVENQGTEYTLYDRILGINLLSALLDAPVCEDNLKECLELYKGLWLEQSLGSAPSSSI